MSIHVWTGDGQALLKAIYKAIDEKKIRTWRYADHGGVRYLTHCADQWDQRAWLKGSAQQPGLVLNIVKPKANDVPTDVYAIYHGRFIEMLLTHFGTQIGGVAPSPLPTTSDLVKAT